MKCLFRSPITRKLSAIFVEEKETPSFGLLTLSPGDFLSFLKTLELNFLPRATLKLHVIKETPGDFGIHAGVLKSEK